MAADPAENQFGISWHDSAWIPILNPENVLEYFSQRTNPFYDRTCNNEIVKMQRLDLSQLQMMQGLEYILLHVQNPILFIIRKQHRHSPTQVTALADYYILAGIVYQSPDLGSLINSRMLSALHNLTSAFDEAASYARYHPSKGYWWEFKDAADKKDTKDSKKDKSKSAPSSMFQRQHIDLLLEELIKKYPPQRVKLPTSSADAAENKNTTEIGKKPEETPSGRTLQGEDSQGQQLGKRPLPTESTEKIPPAKKRK